MNNIIKKYYNKKILLKYDFINEISKNCYGKKMLVFGLGYDSELWYNLTNKNTYFVENDYKYININNNIINHQNIIIYHYNNINVINSLNMDDTKIDSFKIPDKLLDLAPFDIILIDGPVGSNNKSPGRLLPIYWSKKYLSKNETYIYINDVNRQLERKCYDKYFINMNKEIINNKLGKIIINNDVINNNVINNDVINNDVINNDVINNDVINNDNNSVTIYDGLINKNIINNEVINNEVINNEVINNEVINNEVINNIISKKKVALYSCNFGNYRNELRNGIDNIEIDSNIDYYFFTDNNDLKSKKWKIIKYKNNIDFDKNIMDTNRWKTKYIKFILPHILKKYDIVIWFDSKINLFPIKLKYDDIINMFNNNPETYVFNVKHPIRKTMQEELNFTIKRSIENVENGKKFLDSINDYESPFLLTDTCNFARLINEDTNKAFKNVYNLLKTHGLKRDQNVYNYALDSIKHNVKVLDKQKL